MPSLHRARPRRRTLRLVAGSVATTLVAGSAALLLPHAAFAAPAFDASKLYAVQSSSSNVVTIDRTTGAATTVLTAPTGPANNGSFNQLGISADGDKLYMTDSATVREYTASTNTWESTQRSTGATVGTTMGGVNPKTQLFFFGGQTNGKFLFDSYDPATNKISTTPVTVSAAGAPGGSGDLAFDRQGNLYFVSSSGANNNSNTAQLYRVNASDLGGGNTTATAVGPLISNTPILNSLAFGDDGYLYIAGNGTNSFLKVNPVNGKTVDTKTVGVSITDMASNAVPSTGQSQGGFTDGRAKPSDQLTTTISGGDIPTPVSATTSTGKDTVTVGPIILLPGQSYTVDQTPGNTTTDPNAYDTTYKCINLVDGSVVAQGTGTSAPFTVPAGGGDVQCVFSNPLKPSVTNTSSTGNTPGQPVTVDPLAGSQGSIDPTTVTLTPNTPDSTVSNGGKQLTVPGEGTWTVDPQSGKVTFTPESGSTKNPTPVTYTVDDTRGNQTSGQIAVTYKGNAQPDTAKTTQGTAVTVDVLANDQGGTVASSVVFPTSGQPKGATVSTDGKQLTVPGEGTYTIDQSTGKVTFTPDPAFRGTTSPVSYQVADADGATSTATITVQVAAVGPTAKNETATTQQNAPTTVDVVRDAAPGVQGGTPVDPTTVTFPTTGQPAGATTSTDGRQLTVPGQGTYTADPTTGKITFTPAQGFTGTTTPVTYQVGDTGGATGTGTLTVTVTAVTPTAKDDTVTLAQGDTATVDVLGNDTPGNAATPLDPTTVTFPGNGTKQLTVPGEGSYAIDPKSGKVTFTPEPTFRGTATPVTYRVADVDGHTASATMTATVTPVGPAAQDDSATTEQNAPVVVDVTANDQPGVANGTPVDPISVVFPTSGQPNGAIVSPDGKQLTVPGEATYTIDPTTGKVTVTPAQGFTGTTTPVTYQVADTGKATDTATISVTVSAVSPTAKDDTATTDQGSATTVDVLANDTAGNAQTPLDPTTVTFPSTKTGTTSTDGKQLTVPGEGTYTIDPSTGKVTFTPEATFRGTATPVTYQVADTDGTTATATITVTAKPVGPKVAKDTTATTSQNTPATFDVAGAASPGVKSGTPVDPTSVVFPKDGQPTGATVSDDGKQLTVPGEGAYTVDPKTGVVTFTPAPGFSGTTTPVTYQVSDTGGQTSTGQLTTTVTAVSPTAEPDTATLAQGDSATIDVLGNDHGGNAATPLDPKSVVFPAAGQPAGAVGTESAKQLTVPGQGTYAIDPESGKVTFTPEPTFRGTATPVTYQVADTDGTATTATITATVTPVGPAAKDDTATTEQNTPVSITVLRNDGPGVAGGTPLDPASVVFPATGQPNGATVSTDGKQLTVAGQGTYTVDSTTGKVTFAPAQGFSGAAEPVTYRVADTGGVTAAATITVTVTSVAPAAHDDWARTAMDTPVTMSVLSNDDAGNAATPIVRSTVRLIDGSGASVSRIAVPRNGVWSVNDADGTVTFTPEPGFSGPTKGDYRITDTDGHTSDAVMTVVVGTPPTAKADHRDGEPGTATVVDVLGNDGPGTAPIDPESVRLVDPKTGKLVDTVTIAGEGTFTVQPSGTVTFTPVDGYAGTATIRYSVAGEDGSRATATVSVTIPVVPGITQNPAKGGGIIVTTPSGDRLAFTGSDVLWPGLGASFVLMAIGLGLVLLHRRRTAQER
ncbi:CshA-type fibril repeat protein [Curtobacterium citreum]|uniref:beta strand repeat-containing protein n=1 Tax=Curtobacterium citreum TaxID=2036 RepID=UPI001153D456|nr:tandem-95 repeat protein [Curtobacterium citreum]TQJ26904.1 CshA-type fibril repeat protein [Curtobacterium citreum]